MNVHTFKTLFPLVLLGFFNTSYSQNLEWVKSMGGTENETAFSIVVDQTGNALTTGSFNGTADFDPGSGVYNLTSTSLSDIFISKLDSNGSFVWAKQIAGTMNEISFSIATDLVGNVYILARFEGTIDCDPGVGIFNLTAIGSSDIFILKLDINGNFNWAKSMGGGIDIFGSSITISNNGNVYSTGYFDGTSDFDPGPGVYNLTSSGLSDIFISKLDSNGSFIWAKNIGGTSHSHGNFITTDNFENLYVTGDFYGTTDFDPGQGTYNLTANGLNDIFVLKFDSTGSFKWANQVGSQDQDFGWSTTIADDEFVYTTGYFSDSPDFDSGNNSHTLNSAGSGDIFILKTDTAGNFIWAKNLGGSNLDVGYSIDIDQNGNIFCTGFFQGIADFDPGITIYNLTSLGSQDIFIVKLDSTGNFVFSKGIGGPNVDYGNSIAIDNFNNIFVTGRFVGSMDFDPPAGIYTDVYGLGDIFVAKYTNSFTALSEEIQSHDILIYPNPGTGWINIISSGNLTPIEFFLYDLTGRNIIHQFVDTTSTVNISYLPSALYFYELQNKNGEIEYGKFLKQ